MNACSTDRVATYFGFRAYRTDLDDALRDYDIILLYYIAEEKVGVLVQDGFVRRAPRLRHSRGKGHTGTSPCSSKDIYQQDSCLLLYTRSRASFDKWLIRIRQSDPPGWRQNVISRGNFTVELFWPYNCIMMFSCWAEIKRRRVQRRQAAQRWEKTSPWAWASIYPSYLYLVWPMPANN